MCVNCYFGHLEDPIAVDSYPSLDSGSDRVARFTFNFNECGFTLI